MCEYDPTDEHEPYDVDELGMSGVSTSVVMDVIEAVAGPDPYEDGTHVHKKHSARVRAYLSDEVDLEMLARIVLAFERLNLIVHAKEDGRFSDGVNPRALTVVRKQYDGDRYSDVSPWWDMAGVSRGEYTDE